MAVKIPREDLLDELHRLAEDGVAPTVDEMVERGRYSPPSYRRRFGSWTGACEAAGLSVERSSGVCARVPREDLLDELHRLAEDGHAPTKNTMQREGAYSASPYRRAFGSLDEAAEAAGLKPPIPGNLSPIARKAIKAQGGD